MAAGLSLSRRRSSSRRWRGSASCSPPQGAGARPAREPAARGLLAAGGATPELAERIAAAGPYGAGSPAPRLAVAGARIAGARRIGDGPPGAGAGRRLRRAARGGGVPRVRGAARRLPRGRRRRARAPRRRLERDDWGGRARVKLHVEDAAPAGCRPRTPLDPPGCRRYIAAADAPFVYRLGHQIFNLVRRVRLP